MAALQISTLGIHFAPPLCNRLEEIMCQIEVEKDERVVVKYSLKNLGGVTNPVMPLFIIPCCLFLPAFVHWSRQRPQHPGMICQHLTRMWSFCSELGSTALILASSQDKIIRYIKAGHKSLQSKWSQMMGAAENSTVATETENQTPLSCYRNIPLSDCVPYTPTRTEELWGGVLYVWKW